jgi:hypothetical protein
MAPVRNVCMMHIIHTAALKDYIFRYVLPNVLE